jgi:hypothetical protein
MFTLQEVQQLAQRTELAVGVARPGVLAELVQPSSIGSLTTEVVEQGPFS